MKITFLGTGTSQGVPVIGCDCEVCGSDDPRDQRLRSSVAIEAGGKQYVIDCGPDFRQQMLRAGIRSIDAILVTHGHKDHLGGLDDVRAFNYFDRRPANVYASHEVITTIRKEFSYAFRSNPYPGVPQINLFRIRNEPFNIGDHVFTPIKSLHYPERHFVFGFRLGDFTYITDAVFIPEKEKKKITGSKVLVINALRKKEHYSHFNLQAALELMDEFRPEQGYLTHISHQMGLHAAVEQELPDYVKFSYDGLTVSL